MRKLRTLLSIALGAATMIGQASADPIDEALKNRAAMVAAVAMLTQVPDKCVESKPKAEEIILFAMHYRHRVDERFLEDVKAKVWENNQRFKKGGSFESFSKKEQENMLDFMYGMTMFYSNKLREIVRYGATKGETMR